MDQKVKLQLTCDMEDVPRVCSAILSDVETLSVLAKHAVMNARDNLYGAKLNQSDKFSFTLEELEKTRITLLKIDNRIADVCSILAGLKQFAEQSSEKKEEDKNDNINTG